VANARIIRPKNKENTNKPEIKTNKTLIIQINKTLIIQINKKMKYNPLINNN
jgi:hypothetical protein